MQSMVQRNRSEILARAKKHFFSLGVDDGASSLCRANFKYGLAKLHCAQEKLGLAPNATFISTPDETISRNRRRWIAGYGYGGKLCWGEPEDPLIFVDTKPNACGMLVGGIQELPTPEAIVKKINKILATDTYIDGIKLKWDFKAGNHFIDVFESKNISSRHLNLPPYMFIIHGSVPELQAETEKGMGLYYDKSKMLRNMCETMETPFGQAVYLDGTNAKDYFRFFQYAKKFAAMKRKKAAQLLFGKFQVISNPIHQGLISHSEMLLGAHHISGDPHKLFPVALRSDLPAYLMRMLPNLTEEQIDAHGFENRAIKLGVMHRLKNFNGMPHGGGYALPHISRVLDVEEIENERFFVCEQEAEDAITILSDMRETAYSYRGKKIIKKIEELKLGTLAVKLTTKFVLKI